MLIPLAMTTLALAAGAESGSGEPPDPNRRPERERKREPRAKPVYLYDIRRGPTHLHSRYNALWIRVWTAREQSIREKLENAVGMRENTYYWDKPEQADKHAKFCQWLLDRGHEILLDSMFSRNVSVTLQWQEYDEGGVSSYCGMSIEKTGASYQDHSKVTSFLDEVGSNIEHAKWLRSGNSESNQVSNHTFANPTDFIEAIERSLGFYGDYVPSFDIFEARRAKRLSMEETYTPWATHVYDWEDRMELRTDTLERLLGEYR